MERQLVLIPDDAAGDRLDERTRELGRRGVAAAREALRAASTPAPTWGRRRTGPNAARPGGARPALPGQAYR